MPPAPDEVALFDEQQEESALSMTPLRAFKAMMS